MIMEETEACDVEQIAMVKNQLKTYILTVARCRAVANSKELFIGCINVRVHRLLQTIQHDS